ncbi:MAG: 2-C-methyl-D-erythritol 4-phosphate cytidylyltransferase, partial [Clostridia bacterium]|nr:2-C-methyl-D-erythritol 4-phosphate cytidylyltransferase [Clostridia bacterium]
MGKILHGNFNTQIKLRKKTVAIIAAGGKGTRMGLDFNKIFMTVFDKPILAYTLDVFEYASCIDAVILVCSNQDMAMCKEIVKEFGYEKVKSVVTGGSSRQESVRNGLNSILSPCDIVVVHDAARPLVTEEMLEKTIDEAYRTGAASVGVTPVDTVKHVCGSNILETVDRNSLILIQT